MCWKDDCTERDHLGCGAAQDFAEKPKGDALKAMAVDTTILGTCSCTAFTVFACMPQLESASLHSYKQSANFSRRHTNTTYLSSRRD